MSSGLNVAAITNVLKQLDLAGLGSGIGSALAGNNNNGGGATPPPPSNGVDTGATRVLPGKELILPVAADSDEAANIFSKSLSGLDRDTFDRLEKIKQQTEIETGSPREKAYRAAQLRSDIARDRFASMPTRTAWSDVNQFRDPYYNDSSDWDLADSRNAARDTWLDAANIASARKAAAYGDDPFEQGYAPKDAYETEAWTPPAWSEFPKGISGLPQVGSDEWNKKPDMPTIPPINGDPGPVTPVTPVNPVNPTNPTVPTMWKPTANYDGGGYVPGQFGVGPKYAEYEQMFANSIAEGFTLEEAMKLSKVATPYDFQQAFGDSYQWSKHGGGSKTGSAGTKGFNSAAGNAMQGFNKSTNFGTSAPSGQGFGPMASDIQLKENIDFIDKSPAGHSIYQWNYKGEPKSRRYQGVMAQDLLKTSPNAVVKMDNGYLGVMYDEIDVDFIAV
jgi:hypothetical protein